MASAKNAIAKPVLVGAATVPITASIRDNEIRNTLFMVTLLFIAKIFYLGLKRFMIQPVLLHGSVLKTVLLFCWSCKDTGQTNPSQYAAPEIVWIFLRRFLRRP
jgi:hypothetical protein